MSYGGAASGNSECFHQRHNYLALSPGSSEEIHVESPDRRRHGCSARVKAGRGK